MPIETETVNYETDKKIDRIPIGTLMRELNEKDNIPYSTTLVALLAVEEEYKTERNIKDISLEDLDIILPKTRVRAKENMELMSQKIKEFENGWKY